MALVKPAARPSAAFVVCDDVRWVELLQAV